MKKCVMQKKTRMMNGDVKNRCSLDGSIRNRCTEECPHFKQTFWWKLMRGRWRKKW